MRSQDSNLGLLGGKLECFHCAMQPPNCYCCFDLPRLPSMNKNLVSWSWPYDGNVFLVHIFFKLGTGKDLNSNLSTKAVCSNQMFHLLR